METDRSYFTRRAAEERSAATKALGKAREAHEEMEVRYRGLARSSEDDEKAETEGSD